MSDGPFTIGRAAIVGERGRMGQLFAARAKAAGTAVAGIDRPLTPESVARAVEGADLVLLSVPASALEECALTLAPLLAPGQILADICSVKTLPLQAMLAAFPGPVVGTHPLFGPDPTGQETRVAMVPGRSEAACFAVEAWMTLLGFTTFRTTAEEHDRAMAYIQGLNFVTHASYLAAVAAMPAVAEFVTPSFERRLASARKMLTEDGPLFKSLFEANPYSQEAVRGFRSYLNLAAGGEVDLLLDMANWWWRQEA